MGHKLDRVHTQRILLMMIAPNSRARKGGEGGVWKNLRGGGGEC